MRLICLILLIALLACEPKNDPAKEEEKASTYQTIGSIEVMDEALNTLIAPETKIEILAEGFTWSEGPVWVEEIQRVLFSDVPENKVWQWSEADSVQLYLDPSGRTGTPRTEEREEGSNGLILDNDGKLVLCQHGDRRVARLTTPLDDPESEFETLADRYDGKKFNSPNDLIFDKAGNCYFTDPPYGLPKQMEDEGKEIDFQGVYRINVNGEIDLLVDSLTRPNGIELSPDEKTLYVANSDPGKAYWMAYDFQEDGSLGNARIFYDATNLVGQQSEKGLPDGLVIATDGTIYATGPGGVWIFDATGKALGKVRTTQATSNCTLDKKRKILYMTADMYLLRVQLL